MAQRSTPKSTNWSKRNGTKEHAAKHEMEHKKWHTPTHQRHELEHSKRHEGAHKKHEMEHKALHKETHQNSTHWSTHIMATATNNGRTSYEAMNSHHLEIAHNLKAQQAEAFCAAVEGPWPMQGRTNLPLVRATHPMRHLSLETTRLKNVQLQIAI